MKSLPLLFVGLVALSSAAMHKDSGKAAIGEITPAWTLPDSTGKTRSIRDFHGKYVVLEWTNCDCPFVKKHYGSGNMQTTQAKATKMGAVWFSVLSSAPGHEGSLTASQVNDYRKANKVNSTASLLDPTGKVGHIYEAKTTPQIVIIDPKGVVIYNGAIDDRPTADPEDIAGSKNYALVSLSEAMAGKAVSTPRTRSYGCSVKY